MEAAEVLDKEKETAPVKVKTIVRNARISDIPQLVDMMMEFAEIQKKFGNKIYAANSDALRGGICIELSLAFDNPAWKIIVAQRKDSLIG